MCCWQQSVGAGCVTRKKRRRRWKERNLISTSCLWRSTCYSSGINEQDYYKTIAPCDIVFKTNNERRRHESDDQEENDNGICYEEARTDQSSSIAYSTTGATTVQRRTKQFLLTCCSSAAPFSWRASTFLSSISIMVTVWMLFEIGYSRVLWKRQLMQFEKSI